MHDMRKKALKQSTKTISRKARARLDPLNGPGSLSPSSSRAQSRSGSRINSRQSSRINSRQGSRYASEDEDSLSDPNYARMKQLSLEDDDLDDGTDSEIELDDNSDTTGEGERGTAASQNTPEDTLHACITLLQDRKRTSYEARINALETYLQLVQDHYLGSCVADALPTVLEQLLKSIRRSNTDPEEQMLALQALIVTTLTCPKEDSARILESTFSPVRAVCKAADVHEKSKVIAVEALTMVVVFGGGTKASANELLKFLLDIVSSDGQTAEAMDSAGVVTAALRMWAFVASYMMPDNHDSDNEDEDSSGDEGPTNDIYDNSLVAEGQTALEAFIDQLQSTATEVQIAASEAIGLLFEMSRRYEAVTEDQFGLREDPIKLAEQLRYISRGILPDGRSNTKSASRLDRRNLRETFISVATSLELGTGPKYSTAARSGQSAYKSGTGKFVDDEGEGTTDSGTGKSGSSDVVDALGYRMRLQVHNQSILIDSWALSVRVDTLRIMLGRGLHKHLMKNPLVSDLLHATSLKPLQWDVDREQRKKFKQDKRARRRRG
ncbi:ifrd domain containing protein [Grosmannia clavigera kw1407]|uniref:Ifrd domain containing protein n=1 Tax=Grosmannia clavigera (strain kw1407 / UAMH 11150) TaxID=655863 RepID=F0XFP3_GROCL|nr:ifrd domain containing protein [Grosmannia clavigera kw1407]EFX04796.1 ifrd domain containing protein [Grosmannia clavigera kw1407]